MESKFVHQTSTTKLGNEKIQFYEFVSFVPVAKSLPPTRKHGQNRPKRRVESTITMHKGGNSQTRPRNNSVPGVPGTHSNNNIRQLAGKFVNRKIVFIDVTNKYTKNDPHIAHPPIYTLE